MRRTSSYDELTIRNQFDYLCKRALKGEVVDYYRQLSYHQKNEVLFSKLSEIEMSKLQVTDEYNVENTFFQVMEYKIEVCDELLAKAIQLLS